MLQTPLAKNRTISPPPSSRQGHLTRSLCGNSAELLCLSSGLVGRPLEVGSVYPHAVHNHCELARDGNLRALRRPTRLANRMPHAICPTIPLRVSSSGRTATAR